MKEDKRLIVLLATDHIECLNVSVNQVNYGYNRSET